MSLGQICGVAWEDTSPYLMARLISGTNAILKQADVSSISYSVFDIDDRSSPVIPAATIPVSQVIFNTLQTDGRWTVDETGYNFAYAIPVTTLPTGGRIYIVDFHITPAAGAVFPVVFKITTLRRTYATP